MAAAKLGGFFTSLKKEVLTIGQTKTTDLHFDTAKTNYDSFVASVNLLKSHMDVWNSSTRAMCVNAELVAVDYKHVMQTTANHPFSTLANEGKATQNSIFKHYELCEKQLEQTAGAKFKLLIAHFNNIKDRIKAREAARLDFDYRTGQVKSAQDARDKAIGKGKTEAPKDAEKRVLAESKLADATHLWNTTNTALIEDLVHLHENRLGLLGNIYTEFIAVQKAFAAGFANNTDSLTVPQIPSSCAFTLQASSVGEGKQAAGAGGDAFSDVNLNPAHGGKSIPAPAYSGGAAPGGPGGSGGGAASKPPPPAGAPPASKPSKQQIQQQQQAAAAALIMQSLPEPQQVSGHVDSQGLHLSANFAAEDEDEMRMGVTIKPQDAAAAAAFAVKHQAAITKLATVNNKTNQ